MNKHQDDRLHLELSVDVPLARLIEAEEAFRDLINEVGRSVIESARDPIKWIVTEVERGSVRFVIQARPANEKVAPSQMPETVGIIATGLEILETRGERPEYFTYRALEKAKRLGSLSKPDFPIVVRNGQGAAKLTAKIVANVEKLIGEPLQSIGRVEGILERLNIHERRVFTIYDRLTGQGIECHFGDRMTVSEVAAAVAKRVAVYGRIAFSPQTGDIINVKADRLEIVPPQDKLPTAEDVRGILS